VFDGLNTTSDATPSMLPSNARPTSSPLSLSVGDPELPPVISRSLRKSTGSSPPSDGSAYGPYFFALMASRSFCGESNGSLPVFFAGICDATVNGQSFGSFDSGLNYFTVP